MGGVSAPLRWAVLMVLGGLLSACGRAPAAESGVLTGVATPCAGVLTQYQYAKVPIRVTIAKGSQTITSQTVHGKHTYRFVLPHGVYFVSSDQSGVTFGVPVRAGQTAHVNLLAHCK